MKQAFLFLGALLLPAVFAPLAWGDTLVAARQDAARGDYDAALKVADATLQADPGNTDVRLLKAQIHGWQKNYDAARQEFDYLLEEDPSNVDVLLGRGNMYYAENDLDAAEWDYTTALAISPDYGEVRQGLELVQKARENPERNFLWQADVGSEFSTFARQPQTSWDNEFVQLTRQFAASGTAVHALVQRYNEFNETDMYYEIGADQRFTPWLNGYLYTGGTPDAFFRPAWRMTTGGSVRVAEFSTTSLWATLDTAYDDYLAADVGTVNPGARFAFADNWAVSSMLISVIQSGDAITYGWQSRLDGQIEDGWRFYTGYANAPETVAGVTVSTQTVFAGTAIDIGAANTINFGYTHDDRENSYIRHAFNASLSRRF